MGDLCPLALAMIAVAEDNRRARANWQCEMRSRAVCLVEIDRLKREIAARDAALDACADRIAETARAHREQHDLILLQINLIIARLDTLATSGAFVHGARRVLDEVRADLRALATTKGTP